MRVSFFLLRLGQGQGFENLARFRIHTHAPRLIAVINDLDLVKNVSPRLPKLGSHGSSRFIPLSNLGGLRERYGGVTQPIAFSVLLRTSAQRQSGQSDQQAPECAHVFQSARHQTAGKSYRSLVKDQKTNIPNETCRQDTMKGYLAVGKPSTRPG